MPASAAAFLWGGVLSWFVLQVLPTSAASTNITVLAIVKHLTFNKRLTSGSVNRIVHDWNDARKTTLDSSFLQKYHLSVTTVFSINLSPPEILSIICREVRDKRINAIFYMSDMQYEDESSGSTLYLMQIAKFLGLPIIAWFCESSGVIQPTDDSLVLQMSPTIRHQVRAMFSILRRYNWKHFCVVTGETLGRNYFTNVLRSLVDSSDGWFNLFAIIQVTTRDKSHLRTQLQEIVSVESRVILLYASRSESEAIFEVATSLGLTGAGFVWILSTTAIRSKRPPREYPVGILGIDYDTKKPVTISNGLGVWARAMQNLDKRGDLQLRNISLMPELSCDSQANTPWKHGPTVFEFMKNVSRPMTFADDDSATDTELNIINLNTQRTWAVIGKWQSNNDEIAMDDIAWPGGMPTPPKGRPDRYHLKVVTIEEKPYVTYADPDPKTGTCPGQATLCRIAKLNETTSVANATRDPTLFKCCSGLCIDLLRLLSDKIGFDYELFEVEDEKWGAFDKETGEWNGLVRSLMDGKADISMTSLKITPKRSEMIDFSIPFLETGITIIVAVRDGVISPTAFLEPYDYPSWCLILVFSVHASGAAIFIFEWLSPNGLDRGNRPIREHRFSLFRSFWLIWAMLFGAAVNVDNPRGVSSRFLGNIWALFAVVFTASYTANLAAFMITKEDYDRLTGIQDWRLMNPTAHRPPFKFATVPHGSTETTMMNNYPKMHRYMSPYNKSEVAQGVNAVKDGEINAFIYDATVLEYLAAHDDKCKLRTVGNWYAMTGYGVGFPKGSKWIQQFNKYMLQFQHDGEMERLQKFWLAGACKKKDGGESTMPLGIPNFTSAYILLAAGMLLGALLLLLEHTYFKFFRDSLRKIDRCGCCGLVSLSMGQSLTFERSVMQAIELQRNFKCKNPICETHTWKLKHKLDLALLRIDRLQKQVTGTGLAPEAAPPAPSKEVATIGWRSGFESPVVRNDNERPAPGRPSAPNSHQCVVDTIHPSSYSANSSSEPLHPAQSQFSHSPLSGSPATTSRDSRSSSPDDAGRRTTGVRVERWPKRRKGHLYTRVNSDEHVMKETVL